MPGVGNLLAAADVRGVPMTPLWLKDNLILARRGSAGGREYVQGCLLDWAEIRESLANLVRDLLPEATFEPVPSHAEVDATRMLAALPLRIVPGALPAEEAAGLSPLLLSLAVAWACLAATVVTVACLLAGILRLSNRRASFVTAVTHELRTPLTTFQMYVEMMAEGMVTDVEQSRHYLKTLQAEAARLTHMVENVLAYARLERGRTNGHVESIGLGELLDRVQDRLVQRAEPAGMEIVIQGEPSAREQRVEANVSAVEQILFNLVDNACKYASAAEDKRIQVELRSPAGRGRFAFATTDRGFHPRGARAGSAASRSPPRRRRTRRPASDWDWRSAAAWLDTWAATCGWSPAKARGLVSCSGSRPAVERVVDSPIRTGIQSNANLNSILFHTGECLTGDLAIARLLTLRFYTEA